ncbi:MAG: response regulator transcription factor, partial [Chloroflexota bacterium]|nr:response regulator transcription factor [Chloroflexota bacterium]
ASAWETGAAVPLEAIIDLVTELAVRTATAPPEPAAGAKPAPWLTRREREVLRLLVEGRRDPQIGAALSISPRTVESHVGHILTKLGVESRTAAVAHAVRHGLD